MHRRYLLSVPGLSFQFLDGFFFGGQKFEIVTDSKGLSQKYSFFFLVKSRFSFFRRLSLGYNFLSSVMLSAGHDFPSFGVWASASAPTSKNQSSVREEWGQLSVSQQGLGCRGSGGRKWSAQALGPAVRIPGCGWSPAQPRPGRKWAS